MIDPANEELITLTAACKLLPQRRRGKRPNVSTLYRWAGKGCRGIVLETLQIGGTKCTTPKFLATFFQRLTEQRQSSVVSVSDVGFNDAEDKLDTLGM